MRDLCTAWARAVQCTAFASTQSPLPVPCVESGCILAVAHEGLTDMEREGGGGNCLELPTYQGIVAPSVYLVARGGGAIATHHLNTRLLPGEDTPPVEQHVRDVIAVTATSWMAPCYSGEGGAVWRPGRGLRATSSSAGMALWRMFCRMTSHPSSHRVPWSRPW